MTDVLIAGIGQTPVGEHWDISLRELALMAIEAARQDAGGVQPQACSPATCWPHLSRARPIWVCWWRISPA
jgi:acetyl-CoA acetyltransferase